MFCHRIDDELELGLLEPRHAAALYRLVEENRAYLGRWLSWVADTRTPEAVEAFIQRGLEQFARGDGFQAGIWYRGELVGTTGLHHLDRHAGSTELGYWLAEALQGRGVMTRVVRGLCRLLFGQYGVKRLEIRCQPANTRSCAIPERLGFSREGVLRQVEVVDGERVDHVVYGLLGEEWRRHD